MSPEVAKALDAHNQKLAETRSAVSRAKQLMREGASLRFAAMAVGFTPSQLDQMLWKTLGRPMRGL